MSYTFSRRDFMKYSAVAAVAVAGSSMFTGCGSFSNPNRPFGTYNKDADCKLSFSGKSGGFLGIGGTQDYLVLNKGGSYTPSSGTLNLVIVKLTIILHIHLAFRCIYNRCRTVDLYFITNIFYCFDHIRQLANSGWLNNNTIRTIFCKHLFECLSKVTNQRTANATGIHLCNLDSCLFQKSTIDTDLTELVLDQD